MTYYGSQIVVENYNIMGVAKAALESAVRYIAAELGPREFVYTLSLPVLWQRGPRRGSPSLMLCLTKQNRKLPQEALVSIDDVGAATAFLAHDPPALSRERHSISTAATTSLTRPPHKGAIAPANRLKIATGNAVLRGARRLTKLLPSCY